MTFETPIEEFFEGLFGEAANKKARNRGNTLADLLEVSMGTPWFRVSGFDMIREMGCK